MDLNDKTANFPFTELINLCKEFKPCLKLYVLFPSSVWIYICKTCISSLHMSPLQLLIINTLKVLSSKLKLMLNVTVLNVLHYNHKFR